MTEQLDMLPAEPLRAGPNRTPAGSLEIISPPKDNMPAVSQKSLRPSLSEFASA
jgi:hypothetical protein